MNWELQPHKSIGPLEFGMKRTESREALRAFENEREDGQLSESEMPSDIYANFEVRFSKYDRCAAVELQSENHVSFNGHSLFELKWSELEKLLRTGDDQIQIGNAVLLSHALGIRAKKDKHSDIASEILCFEADYFYLYKEIPLPAVTSSFYVQVGFVEDVELKNETFENLTDGAQSLFANTKEKGIFLWNNLPVPFDYQTDLAEIIMKITPVIREIYWAERGDELFSVQSKNLDFGWRIVWEGDVVNIDSDWRKVPGNLQDVANEDLLRKVITSKEAFLAEWKMLIFQFDRAVSATGSSFKDLDAQEVVLELQNLTKSIKNTGKFYQKSNNGALNSIEKRNASLRLLIVTVGIFAISFGFYWLATKDGSGPFQWMKNNWIPLVSGIVAVFVATYILSFFVRKKKLK